MKKRLLIFIALIFVLTCVFAITANAENRTSIAYTDIDGVSHNVPIVKYPDATAEKVASTLGHNKATMQSCFMDNGAYAILKDSEGSLTAYPTWYIIEPSGSSTSYVAISEIRYGYVNEMSKKTYSNGAVLYIEFPSGMTCIRDNSVFGGKSKYEVNVTDIYIPNTVTYFGGENGSRGFNASSVRRVYFEQNSPITEIPSGCFSNSPVEYIQFESLTSLKTIDGCTTCNLTGELDLSKTKVEELKNGAFKDNVNITKITLPDTLKTIGDSAFENCGSAYLSSPYLPSSLTYIGIRFFAYNNNLLDTYIFPEGVTSLGNEPFQNSKVSGNPSGKKLSLVFLGKVTGVVYLNGNGHQLHADEVTVYFAQNSLAEYNTNGFYIKPSSSSYTDVPRAIRACFCAGTGKLENGVVTGVEYIYITNVNGNVYTDDMVNDSTYGFDFEEHTHLGAYECVERELTVGGFDGVNCIICDMKQGVSSEPIFKSLGYAVSEISGAVSQSYAVDRKSFKEYVEKNGEVTFGVLAALDCEETSSGKLFNDDLTALTRVKTYNFTSCGYDIVEIKIKGIDSENLDTGIFCCMYYIENGKVYYINEDKTLETAVSTSYNAVANKTAN